MYDAKQYYYLGSTLQVELNILKLINSIIGFKIVITDQQYQWIHARVAQLINSIYQWFKSDIHDQQLK